MSAGDHEHNNGSGNGVKRRVPYFSFEISLGNIISMLMLIVMVGGGIYAAYHDLQQQIATLNTNFTRLQTQQDETRRRVDEAQAALSEARASVTALGVQVQSALTELRTSMGADLKEISQGLANLRVLVAGMATGGKHR